MAISKVPTGCLIDYSLQQAKEETCSVLVDATVRCSDTLVLARLKREGDRFRMKVQDVSGILNEQDE